jgi:hypothetical protein
MSITIPAGNVKLKRAYEPPAALAAGAAEGEYRIHLVLDPEERVENDWPTIVKVDFKGIKARAGSRRNPDRSDKSQMT